MSSTEERIRRYLRSRADLPVPQDLRWPSTRPPRSSFVSYTRWLGLAAAVLLTAVLIRSVVGTVPANRSDGPAASSGQESAPVAGEFPTVVAGMPVVSVAEAVDLEERGRLDGRAVAVAGYFFEATPSCPAPSRYIGPLEDWCRFVAFTDDRASATLCTSVGNATTCRQPSGTYLAPFFVPETSGAVPRGIDGGPAPLVLIGHAGDPRLWQCGADVQEACGRAFVVDRVAWAGDHDVPLAATESGDNPPREPIIPRMAVRDVMTALGVGDNVLAATAVRAADISTIDPRWNLAGDNILWVVWWMGDGEIGADATRSVTVSLVDDASGEVVNAHDLAPGRSYQPARLWTVATANGTACCGEDVYAFYSLRASNGTLLHDGMIGGGAWGVGNSVTFGPGAPLVLAPGTYSLSVWLSGEDGVIASSGEKCTSQVTLHELDDLMLEAQFPAPGQPCTFEEPSAPELSAH